jgi:hypothetical protein
MLDQTKNIFRFRRCLGVSLFTATRRYLYPEFGVFQQPMSRRRIPFLARLQQETHAWNRKKMNRDHVTIG